jgi:hypothetical protein
VFRRIVPTLGCCASVFLLVGCSGVEPVATVSTLTSEHELVDADVRVAEPVLRGGNDLFVALHPRAGAADARLLRVAAAMPAHGHTAVAEQIELDGDTFHASGLNLYMTGRWLVTLEVTVDTEDDSLSLPVDVP